MPASFVGRAHTLNAMNAKLLIGGQLVSCTLNIFNPNNIDMSGNKATIANLHSGAEHEQLDREGIHWRICEFLGPLRRPFSGIGTQQEREIRHQQQTQRKVCSNACSIISPSFPSRLYKLPTPVCVL